MKKNYLKPETELLEVAATCPMLGISNDPNHLDNGTDEDAGVKKRVTFDDDNIWNED